MNGLMILLGAVAVASLAVAADRIARATAWRLDCPERRSKQEQRR